jgi:YesN/AraC family two-component response regulator
MSLKKVIVDDEPLARKILREELEAITDIEIIGEADNAPTGLAKIAQDHPDLVILDLQMPIIGGLDVIRAARACRGLSSSPPTTNSRFRLSKQAPLSTC